MVYKIGQLLTSNQDTESERALPSEKVIIPKGAKFIIGADNLAHHLRDNMVQPLGNAEVKGYDPEGLAEYLAWVLMTRLPNTKMLYDEIELALEDIGF